MNQIQLGDGSASSIFVSGGTVYTAGQDSSLNACFWKGTAKIILGANGTALMVREIPN
jgi:hypothetical protein